MTLPRTFIVTAGLAATLVGPAMAQSPAPSPSPSTHPRFETVVDVEGDPTALPDTNVTVTKIGTPIQKTPASVSVVPAALVEDQGGAVLARRPQERQRRHRRRHVRDLRPVRRPRVRFGVERPRPHRRRRRTRGDAVSALQRPAGRGSEGPGRVRLRRLAPGERRPPRAQAAATRPLRECRPVAGFVLHLGCRRRSQRGTPGRQCRVSPQRVRARHRLVARRSRRQDPGHQPGGALHAHRQAPGSTSTSSTCAASTSPTAAYPCRPSSLCRPFLEAGRINRPSTIRGRACCACGWTATGGSAVRRPSTARSTTPTSTGTRRPPSSRACRRSAVTCSSIAAWRSSTIARSSWATSSRPCRPSRPSAPGIGCSPASRTRGSRTAIARTQASFPSSISSIRSKPLRLPRRSSPASPPRPMPRPG